MQRRTLVAFMLLAGFSTTRAQQASVLLQDDFSDQKIGMFSTFVKAHTEYHYRPDAAPKGLWEVSTAEGETGSQRAWWIFHEEGRNLMVQTYDNPDVHTHPMVIAGDPLWDDYTMKVSFAPGSKAKQSGILFRYQNDRCYYFCGVIGDKAIMKMVRHATALYKPFEKILDSKAIEYSPGEYLTLSVTVQGNRLSSEFDSGVRLVAENDTYSSGKIGLMSDIPTKFREVSVTTTTDTLKRYHTRKAEREQELAALSAQLPSMKVWKKISTDKFGTGRNLRFGDLDMDGDIDVLVGQVVNHGPKGDYSEVSCLTAMTFDGDKLWQIGEPDLLKYFLTNDVGMQIHDIDRNGRNEVVYCMNSEIIVADGATGKTKYKAPTPKSNPPADKYERILGDCLMFCDTRGQGYDQDIVIKDRQNWFWVLDENLQELWGDGNPDKKGHQIGHYPYASDIDGDGKDELAIGYRLYDDDGRQLWNKDYLHQHADGVAIVEFGIPNDPGPQIFYAASDEGYLRLDKNGKILKHHFIGHVQNPSVANYRSDLPGLETVSINFHGNQGIITYYNAKGDIYEQIEPVQHGSMMLPLNWTGDGEEFYVLSADVEEGGIYDGWGRRVLTFPGDGHPVMCNAVLDITGDCRDEIVVWDPYEIWVYTQSDNPKTGKLYKPERNPLYNYSNYQATVSLPGWTE